MMHMPFYGAASIPKADRPNIINRDEFPGPGSYDANKEKKNNELPKWSLKKRLEQGSCFQNLSITPGPGCYQSQEGFKKQKEMIISTKGEKYKTYNDKSYPHSPINLPGALNLKAGHSFGYRDVLKENQLSPGPIYHLDEIVQSKRLNKNSTYLNGFGCQEKNKVKNDSTPGPGSFEYVQKDAWVNKTCESWTFGSSNRGNSLPTSDIGPGQYNPKFNQSSGRSFKLRGRNEPKQYYTSAIGPGAYSIPDTKTKLGTKFNTPKDKTLYESQQFYKQQQNLSPCSYSPPRYLDRPQQGGCSLGMKINQQMGRNSQAPGPGTYEISGKYNKNNGGYMGRKVEKKKKQNISMDNFYRYNPNINTVARESPKFSFPQSQKQDKQNFIQTNHKFYTSIDSKGQGYSYSMGTSKRFPQMRKQPSLFKQRQTNYSATGLLPNYLKKSSKKH